MADLAKLNVVLEAQTQKYSDALDRANKKLDRFAKQQTSALDGITKGFKVLAGAVAGVQFTAFIKGTINAANHMDDLSTRLGITVEDLSRLQYAAELTGVSAGTLEMGLQRMTRRIAEAAQGSGEAVKALQALNLSAKDLAQTDPSQQFKVLANALMEVENQGERVALAMKLLDSEGVALLQTMEGGAAAIDEMANQSDRLGRTMTTGAAEAATEFNAKMITLKGTLTGIANQIGNALLPSLNKMLTAFFEFANIPDDIQRVVDAQKELLKVQKELGSFMGSWGTRGKMLLEKEKRLIDELAAAEKALYDRRKQEMTPGDGDVATGLPNIGGADPTVDKAAQAAAAREDKLAKAAEDRLKRDYEVLRVSLLDKESAIDESYARRLITLNDMLNEELITEAKHLEQVKRMAEKSAEEKLDLQKKTEKAQENSAVDFFGNIAQISEGENGRLREISKAAAITQVIISAASATMKAFDQGGWISGPMMAASIAGVAATQIATIAGARAMGGPVTGGSTYLVGERGPELFTPNVGGDITPNNELGGSNVTIIEDASRAGQVVQGQDRTEVYVAAFRSAMLDDISRGRGVASVMERKYGLRRNTG